jgi:molecular chaperone DnaJ
VTVAQVRDLYEILGVGRDASQDDIKRAYRRLARELHPDVSGDAQAEERFKEVTAAYEILSDPEKRARYDTFGSAGGPAGMPADIADIFDMFFGPGGFGGIGGFGRRTRPSRARRGDDVFVDLPLTFEEAAFGVGRDLEVESLARCAVCAGTGAEPGTQPSRCHTCGGVGEVQEVRRSIFGTMMTSRTCPTCEGTGEEITEPCHGCGGDGRVRDRRVVRVEVPPGVSDGMELRVTGAGNAGRAGGADGDLYVGLRVMPSPTFERRGQDLFAVLELPMAQAALGADVEIPTLDGPETIRIDPGAASGDTIRVKGKGVPNLGRRGRGDLFLTLHVETPTGLGRDQRDLLERFAGLRGESPPRRGAVQGRLRRRG